MKNLSDRFSVSFRLALLMASITPAIAATYTWTGPGGSSANPVSGLFNDAANWADGSAPVANSAGHDFVFGGSVGDAAYTANQNIATNDTNVRFYMRQLTLQSSSAATNIITGHSLSFAGVGTAAIVQNGSGAFTIASAVTFSNTTTFSGTGSGLITISGQLKAGSLNIAHTGGATLRLSGNSNQGANTITLNTGTLDLTAAGALGANLVLNGGTLLSSNGVTLATRTATTLGGNFTLGGAGNWSLGATAVSLSGAAGTTRTITANTGGTTGATIAGAITGDAGLALSSDSTGTLTLTGTSTYTGPTSVGGGKLLVNGSITSAVSVNAGTFGGTGSSSGAVTVGTGSGAGAVFVAGTGLAVGTFTTANTLTLNQDATYSLVFDSALGTFSQVVAANVALGNAALSLTDLGGAALNAGQTFTIVDNTGATSVTGQFLGLAEGAEVVSGLNRFQISYLGGTGNDITLTTLAPIPEPAAGALLLGGSFLLLVLRRRSRH